MKQTNNGLYVVVVLSHVCPSLLVHTSFVNVFDLSFLSKQFLISQ